MRHLAVPLQERGHHLLHLRHRLGGGRIQRLLGHRLFAAALAACGLLQGWVGSQERIELHQALRATQQGQQNIEQFVLRAILDRLLLDVNPLLHLGEDAARFQVRHQPRQTGMGAKRWMKRCDRLRHADPPVRRQTDNFYPLRMHQHAPSWQAHPAHLRGASLDKI